MSKPSRRPSISIHDYPEHLNPFNDNSSSVTMQMRKDNKSTEKETKHKFWSFGKGRKKRSHSFSIKSTWNGLFGKCKEAPEAPERRSMITTVSTTYKRGDTINSSQNGRQSKTLTDQQEFDEALGTLARRRKYTLDNGSRYNSSLTVNGDPARIYDGSPQETTASIMGDLTPKPPARKFGQVSPKPKEKIPPLDFEGKEHLSNGYLVGDDREPDRAPIPPRRSGLRASQRFSPSSDIEEEGLKSGDVTLRDENENVPDDYIFKRFSHDAVRKSNLSINSCISISSNASGYTRKKRRAPLPPKLKNPVETTEEGNVSLSESRILETPVADPLEISRVAEDIEELTKKTQIDDDNDDTSKKSSPSEKNIEIAQNLEINIIEEAENSKENLPKDCSQIELSSVKLKDNEDTSKNLQDEIISSETKIEIQLSQNEEAVEVELRKKSEDSLEIIKEVIPQDNLIKKKKSPTLSRSNSFCVKEQIEKIEKKLNDLELRRKSEDSTDQYKNYGRCSIEENRRHFFQDLVNDSTTGGVKVELKELPREQTDCHVIRLTDPPISVEASQDPVKIIELHIHEPIRQKPEILSDNPIPKPRRNSALSLERQPSIHGDIKREDSHPIGSSL